MNKKFLTSLFILLVSLSSFAGNNAISTFAKGADVSWVTQMEAAGKKFYNSDGTQMECMALLKSLGINSIRLRAWVNPTNGWCNTSDVLTKAKRANALGMRIMIDFHYSDTWADPTQQTKPAAWSSLSFADLKQTLANYTIEVLDSLKNNGITPEWVQVGNETGNGMLWDDGKASVSMANYAALTTTGYDAVKSVFPNAKVVVHLQNGYDNSLYRWLFDGLKANNAKWDVIGMSLYPYWYTTSNDWKDADIACLNNMNDMVARYGKEVMIVECGMSWDSPSECKDFLTDIIAKTKSVTGGKGLGVFYWEPESYGQWQGYTLGAFDNSGKPTIALDAFNTSTNVENVTQDSISWQYNKSSKSVLFNKTLEQINVYDINGRLITSVHSQNKIRLFNLLPSFYIININDGNIEKTIKLLAN